MRNVTTAAALCGSLLLFSSMNGAWGQPAGSPWPMLGRDGRKTYRSSYKGPSSPILAWSYKLGHEPGWATIGIGGELYISTWDFYKGKRMLYRINSNGSLTWTYPMGEGITSSAVDKSGRIYVGSLDNRLYCLDSKGSLSWSWVTPNDIRSAPAIGKKGRIYFGSSETYAPLYCLNSDGSFAWSFYTASSMPTSKEGGPKTNIDFENTIPPVIGADGKIYTGPYYGAGPYPDIKTTWGKHLYQYCNLVCLNSDGSLVWERKQIESLTNLAAGPNGTVYAYYEVDGGSLFRLDSKGSLDWSYTYGPDHLCGPYDSSENIYMANLEGRLLGVKQSGILHWSYVVGEEIYSTPCKDAAGNVYVGCGTPVGWGSGNDIFNLYSLTPAGAMRWSYDLGDPIDMSPVIGSDGTIYTGVGDNYIYALNDPTPSPTPTPDPRGPWPMFRKDEWNSGSSPYEGLDATAASGPVKIWGDVWHGYLGYSSSAVDLKWTYTTGGSVRSSPAIGLGGIVYAGSDDGRLYCLDSSGAILWDFKTGNKISSSPLVERAGEVYVGSTDGRLYRINSDGSLSWSFTTGGAITSSPAPLKKGSKICVGSNDKKLYCINADGSLAWTRTTGGKIESSPAVDKNGNIYVGSYDKKLYCFKPNGSPAWTLATGGAINSSPAIGRKDGRVHAGSLDNRIYCLESDGSLLWTYETGGDIYSSPALKDGAVYVQSYDNYLYCINSTGTLAWALATGDVPRSSPAVDAAGRVYAGSDDGRLYGLESTPSFASKYSGLLWTYLTGGAVHSSPAVGKDGTICAGSADKNIYALGPGTVMDIRITLLYDPPRIRYHVPAENLVNPPEMLIRTPYDDLVMQHRALNEALERCLDVGEREELQLHIGLLENAMEAVPAREEGNMERANDLYRQIETMVLEGRIGRLEEALFSTEDPDERMGLQRERDLFGACLEMARARSDGNYEYVEELARQIRAVLLENKVGEIEAALAATDNEIEMQLLEIERELLHLDLAVIGAERAGAWENADLLRERINALENQWDSFAGRQK